MDLLDLVRPASAFFPPSTPPNSDFSLLDIHALSDHHCFATATVDEVRRRQSRAQQTRPAARRTMPVGVAAGPPSPPRGRPRGDTYSFSKVSPLQIESCRWHWPHPLVLFGLR